MEDQKLAKISPELVKSVNNTVCRLSKMDANSLKIWYMLSSYYQMGAVTNRVITLSAQYVYDFLGISNNRKRSMIVTSVLNSISECGFVQLIEDSAGDTVYKVAPFASYVEFSLKTQKITIKINEEAEVFLQVTQFAKVYLNNIQVLKTTEEIVLYTLFQLRKGLNNGKFSMKLDELKLITNCSGLTYTSKVGNHLFMKKILGMEKIEDSNDYKVIKITERTKDTAALSAINAFTELEVSCTPIKGYKGKVNTIEFNIVDRSAKPLPFGFNPNHVDTNSGADIDMVGRREFNKSYMQSNVDINTPESIFDSSFNNHTKKEHEYIVPVVIGNISIPFFNMVRYKDIKGISEMYKIDINDIVAALEASGYIHLISFGGYSHKQNK